MTDFLEEDIDSVTNGSVHQRNGLWEKIVLFSCCFGVQVSVAPTKGEELEQVVSHFPTRDMCTVSPEWRAGQHPWFSLLSSCRESC